MKRLTLFALAMAMFITAPLFAAGEKMNVLFVVSDDLTPRTGSYGYEHIKTPHMDALAKRGVQFDLAYCQYPLCAPSRASFMTGMYPQRTGVVSNAIHIRKNQPDAITLGQLFRKNGYYAARVGKIFHYGVPGEIGTDGAGDDPETWDHKVNPAGKDIVDEKTITNYMPRKGTFPGTDRPRLGAALSWRADPGTDEEQTDGMVALETMKLLQQNKDKPFFIACGFYRPHVPSVAPEHWFDLYPEDAVKLPEEPADHLKLIPKAALRVNPPSYGIAPQDLIKFKRAYLATISFMDAQLGKVLAELERLDLADNTIVVMTSDHGWLLGEHGGQWQKSSLFELSAKVPLIIYDPRAKGNGQRCARTVELVDLYPTLADLCGLSMPGIPGEVQGQSLRPLLNDPKAEWKHPAYTVVGRGNDLNRSVRTERYRYTEWGEDGKEGIELYDYRNDPHEWKNLAKDPQHADLRERLANLLDEMPGQ